MLKLKENDFVLLINLARRSLDEKHFSLAKNLLNVRLLKSNIIQTCISICLISSDLMQQHKAKGMSRDCIQRLLGGIAEFAKTWLEASRDETEDYTAQLFSIWKHVL